jgi:hypothetical protein
LPDIPLPVSSPGSLEGTHSPFLSTPSCLDPSLPSNYQEENSPQPTISPDCTPREFISLPDDAEDKLSNTISALKSDRIFDEGKMLIGAQSLWPDMERAQVSPRLLTKNGADSILCDPPSASTSTEIKLPSKRKTPPGSPHSQHTSCSSSSGTPPNFDPYMQRGIELRSTSSQSNLKTRPAAFNMPTLAELSAGIAREEMGVTMAHLGMTNQSQTNGHGYNDCMPTELSQRSGSPPISNTLAVIKATAFGALRRNRSQRKRGDSHATKVALEALEARGLGLGLQPTMTLSSSHSVHPDSPTDDMRRNLMAMEPHSLSEE